MATDWTIREDEHWLDDYVRSVISSTLPPLPAREQRFGSAVVRWWDGKPGDAVIVAEGGSIDDRVFAEHLCAIQLAGHGYRRAQFSFDSDEEMRKTAGWPDIMAKAKRLMQSGQVTLLRNSVNVVAAHVIGDHGEYNCEIGRDDPNSQSITTWQCECPWDQYAWQRTRQWKKYEGRPCAHVLAAYWTSKTAPLDDYDPNQHGPMPGQKMAPPPPDATGPPVAPPQGQVPGAPAPPGGPQIPGPPGQPPDAMGGPIQAPLAPPGAPGILPPSPMEQLQMQQPPAPGMTPGGMPSPPGSVSVPGAKTPGPFNPIQYPGGTYSSAPYPQVMFHATDAMPDLIDEHGLLADPSSVDPNFRGYGFDYGDQRFAEPGVYMAPAEHMNQWADPYSEIYRVDTSHLDPSLMQEDVNAKGAWVYKGNVPPHAIENHGPLNPEELQPHTAAQEYFPQQAVILKNSVWGQMEGKSEEHGAGQYVEVQARKPDGSPQHAEVLYQDPTTEWIEIAVSNDEGKALEPTLTRCFVEPGDILPARNNDPGFIQRRR